jgi:acetylornithine deacetylase/succinyl-diaminopimelate desuccinylase-like protein
VVVSAHLDTVFPIDTDLSDRQEPGRVHCPGIGDNAMGVAGLFGLLWALRQAGGDGRGDGSNTYLPGDVWLAANVGEEGLGDLRGMRAVVDRFGKQPRAYIVLEGMSLGQVYHRGLEVLRYRISVHTQGGHSWVNFGRPSAVHELAQLITRITGLRIPTQPRTSFNVGVIQGGTSVNTIAAEASMELDLRSEGSRALNDLARRVKALVQDANRPNVRATLDQIGHRPAGKLSAGSRLVRLAWRCLEDQGIQPVLSIGSTDANIPLSRGLPAVCVGLTTGSGAHTIDECIDTAPIADGLAQLVALVEGAFRVLP